MPNMLAFSETRLGEMRRAGLETVTAARQVADVTSVEHQPIGNAVIGAGLLDIGGGRNPNGLDDRQLVAAADLAHPVGCFAAVGLQ